MLSPFAQDIWLGDGDDVTVLGFHYSTRMAVIKLSDGGLFIWSPIALTDNLKNAVDDIGSVQHIVAPNSLHHLFIGDWVKAYPKARLYAPPGLREKRKDITFHEDLTDHPSADWQDDLDQVLVHGNAITTEAVFFHRRSGTVLVTDLIQNFSEDWFSGWRKFIAKLDLMVAPTPSVPRKFRVAFTNKVKARESVSHMLQWPAERLVMAHGAPVTQDGKACLGNAFHWLMR